MSPARFLGKYCIVLGKFPYPHKCPPPNFDSFVVFEVLCVVAHHPCIVNPKVSPLSSYSCNCSDALWAPQYHTFRGIIHSVLPLQHKIHVLQATTECCGNLATSYIWIGPCCTTLQLSPRSGWPQQSTDEVTMQVDMVPPPANFTSRVGPCRGMVEPFKHLLCATTYGRLPGTIPYMYM